MKESFKIFTIFSGKYFEKLCKNYRENERNSEFIGKKFHEMEKGKRNANFSKNYKQSFTNVIRFSQLFLA